MLVPTLSIAAALTLGAPSLGSLGHLSLGVMSPRRTVDLEAHAAMDPPPAAARPVALSLAGGPQAPRQPPPCAGDVCQPAVDVPGVEVDAPRATRNELVLEYLSRAHVEPLATILRDIVESGLNVDYTPPMFDGGVRGWGSVMVRLKLRLDARNAPVLRRVPR